MKDTRLRTGYEAVPTRDIHMNQVGLEKHWLEFLRSYVLPIQKKAFIGYIHDVCGNENQTKFKQYNSMCVFSA